MSQDKSQYFNSCTPLIDSGTSPQALGVTQTLENLLKLSGPTSINVQVNGPQTEITEEDIAGVYPAPGSTDSPDDYLPHIALNRRTLPWERVGVGGQKPWLALLLVKDSELTPAGGAAGGGGLVLATPRRLVRPGPSVVAGTVKTIQSRDALGYGKAHALLDDSVKVNLLFLSNKTLVAIRPASQELRFLCNVKRTNKGKGDEDCAIVICNRLPDSGPDPKKPAELHTAFLVSLEGRDDFYDSSRSVNTNGEIGLIVLHSWSFTPSKGGDFEQVIRSIHVRPNGGVLRFGNLPAAPPQGQSAPLSGGFDALLQQNGLFIDPLPHTQAGDVSFRGPLRPFPPSGRGPGFAVRSAPEEFANAPADAPLDYSHAVAFELGKLLAVASHDVLEDLRKVHGVIKPPIEPEVAINKLPVVLQKPEWVTDPAWVDEPWSFAVNNALDSITKAPADFIGATPGDVSGINQQWEQFGSQVQAQLNGMQVAVSTPVAQIDISNVTVEGLDKIFVNVAAKGQV